MTLSTTANKVSYAGDGATVSFAIPFLFLENGHVEAILRAASGGETTWALNTQFTLSGAGTASGGTLTVSTSPTDYTPATGGTLVLRRVVPETQDTDYPEGGAFPAAAHEQALDKLTMLVQQHSEEIARAPVLPVSSSLTDITVPEPGASELIRWNADGSALETARIADLSLDLPAEIDTPSLGDALIYNGETWANRTRGIINALDYGAVGDGVADDTAALQAAIAAASGSETGARLFIPVGVYKITAALDCKTGWLTMQGAGRGKTVIKQHTDNIAMLEMGGALNTVSDMSLQYNTAQEIANTGANCIEFYADFQSNYERLNMYRCNRGMYIPQEVAAFGSNYVFSCTFSDIRVTRYSNNGFDLTAYLGGISGNVMSNIYLLARDDDSTKLETNTAAVFGAWGNGVINQLNIESSKPTQGIYCNTCAGMVFNAVHFEQVEPRTNYGGFMFFAGEGNHVINNLAITYSTIDTANAFYAVRVSSANCKVKVTGVGVQNSTVTGGVTFGMFGLGTETGVELYADLVDAPDLTTGGFSSSDPSAIRRYKGVKRSTFVTPYRLTETRQAAALKDALPDVPNGTTLGLGDALASVITGTTTNGGVTLTASETAAFYIQLPEDYDNTAGVNIRLSAKVSAARQVSATIDAVGAIVGDDGGTGADIVVTTAQNLTTSYANYDFTMGASTLYAGALIYVKVTLATNDTGGITDGFPMIGKITTRSFTARH